MYRGFKIREIECGWGSRNDVVSNLHGKAQRERERDYTSGEIDCRRRSLGRGVVGVGGNTRGGSVWKGEHVRVDLCPRNRPLHEYMYLNV